MKLYQFAFFLLMLTAILGGVKVSKAVTCDVSQLSPCSGAIISNKPPSEDCCNKLREQRPCLCGYLKDPNLRPYIDSPGAKRVASDCGVPTPKCS